MRTRFALTFIEVMVAVAIIMVLAALLFPVFVRVKETMNVGQSLGRLHELHIAAMNYQADWDGDGTSYRGLPTYDAVYSTYLDLGKDFFKSPCGYRAIIPNTNWLGYQYAWDGHPDTVTYFNLRGGDSILFTDASCNESRAVWESPPAFKRGLGVRLNGNLVNLRKSGLPIELYWWDP